MKMMPIFALFAVVLVAGMSVAAINTSTYSYVATDRAYVASMIYLDGNFYFITSQDLYKYSSTGLSKVLTVASDVYATDVASLRESIFYYIYIAGVEYTANTSGGGGGSGETIEYESVSGGVDASGNYDLSNFEIIKVDKSTGNVQATYTHSPQDDFGVVLGVYGKEGLLRSFRFIHANGVWYGYGTAHNTKNNTVMSYVYTFDGSTWTLQKLWYGSELQMFYVTSSYIYAELNNVVYVYDTSFHSIRARSDIGGYSSIFNDIIDFGPDVVMVGYAVDDSGNKNAVLYEANADLSADVAYMPFGETSFQAVAPYNDTCLLIVDDQSTAHVMSKESGVWREVYSLGTDRSRLKDFSSDTYYSMDSTMYFVVEPSAVAVSTNTSARMLWGGIITNGDTDYAYFTYGVMSISSDSSGSDNTSAPDDWDENASTTPLGGNAGVAGFFMDNSSLSEYAIIGGAAAVFIVLVAVDNIRRRRKR